MGYLSCNAHSAISTCDSSNWDHLLPKTNLSKSSNKRPSTIHQFDYSLLQPSISPENLLGKGSSGSVYLTHLKTRKLTALVALKLYRQTQPNSNAENEIEILSTIYHPRIVNLLGFAFSSELNRKLIVVEYMRNGSLHDLLHGSDKRVLTWTKRIRFMLQIAQAVLFLHESDPPIIHRDIKSSNVLIDSRFNCRLSDFGLALRGHVEDVRVKCTPPAGTLGYLDPSYLLPADLSSKLDVFSFGILMMEIVTGRKAIDVEYSPPSVVDWAVPAIRSGDYLGICDPRIGVVEDGEGLRRVAILAGRCVRSKVEKRPEMKEVVECLKGVCRRMKRMGVYRGGGCIELGRVVEYEPLEETNVRVRSTRRVVRSKSVGATREREIKFLASSPGVDSSRMGLGRTMMRIMPTVSKSRSMGIMQGTRMMITGNVGIGSNKFEESKLLVVGLAVNSTHQVQKHHKNNCRKKSMEEQASQQGSVAK